jgi:predicted  nucleic acid-binding Zn-ribbon protein
MSNQMRVFVIMPFDEKFTAFYNLLIKRVLEDLGYEVSRADESLDQQNVMRDVIGGIALADLVVADITGLNPNVMYELGICHALNKPTIHFTQDINSIPFDLKIYRTHEYSSELSDHRDITDIITNIGERHKNREINFSNPVIDFLPENYEKIETRKVAVKEEEKGFLDFLNDINEAIYKFNEHLGTVTDSTIDLKGKLEAHTAEISSIQERKDKYIVRDMKQATDAAATDIDKNAETIEKNLPGLKETLNAINENYFAIVEWFGPLTEKDKENIGQSKSTFVELLDATREARPKIKEYSESVSYIRSLRISKNMTKATKRLFQALTGLLKILDKTEAFCVAILEKIDGLTVSNT